LKLFFYNRQHIYKYEDKIKLFYTIKRGKYLGIEIEDEVNNLFVDFDNFGYVEFNTFTCMSNGFESYVYEETNERVNRYVWNGSVILK